MTNLLVDATGRLLDHAARRLHAAADTCAWLAVLTRCVP